MDFLKSSSQPLSLPVDLQTPPDSLNSLIILSRYVVSLYKESGGVWSFAPDSSNPDSKYKGAFGKQARYAKSSRVAGASKKNVIQFLVRTKKNALANPSPSKTALKTGSGTAVGCFEDLLGRCVAEWKAKPAKQAEIQVEVDENDFFENDFPDYPRRVSIRAPALADKSGGVWRYDQFTCNINMLGEIL
jgi:hypothetical protein